MALYGCGAKTLDVGSHPGAGGSSGGSTPVDGTHSTVLIPHLLTPHRLAVEGDYLYWLRYGETAREIGRCEKRNCQSTQEVVIRDTTLDGLVVRNETLYFAWQGGIASCKPSDCATPEVIVKQGTPPAFVDESHVFWISFSDNAILSCPLTGCEKATAAAATGVGTIISGMTTDETQIYWTVFSGSPTEWDKFSLMSARKDGSTAPKRMASGLVKPTSLATDGGFVYWASLDAAGAIARCPTSGCADGKPDIVASQHYYPQRLTASGGQLFWLDETEPSEKLDTQITRPGKVFGCSAASCADSLELLDESMAGGLLPPNRVLSMPPQQMVADAEALYWFGDVVPLIGPDGGLVALDISVRRLERRPRK